MAPSLIAQYLPYLFMYLYIPTKPKQNNARRRTLSTQAKTLQPSSHAKEAKEQRQEEEQQARKCLPFRQMKQLEDMFRSMEFS